MPSKNKMISSISVLLMSILLCISACLPLSANCDDEQIRQITLICRNENVTLQGMHWDLYRIGERSGDNVVLTGDFAGYPIEMKDLNEDNVEQKAKTLESYTVADKIKPIASDETNTDGELTFSGLSSGVYLAVGKNLSIGSTVYVPSSLILEAENDDISFSYDAFPKFMYATLGSEVNSYTVKKVWINDTNQSVPQPTEVTVDLYKNGDIFDTVTLSDKNKWTHSWTDLDSFNRWHVVERNIPVNYKVIIDYNSTQYLIKNSYIPDDTSSSTTTAATSTATSVVSTMTTASDQTSSTSPSSTTTRPKTIPPTTVTTLPPLAQTGQLWWPVVVMTAAGILFICFGILLRRKKDDE